MLPSRLQPQAIADLKASANREEAVHTLFGAGSYAPGMATDSQAQ